MAVENFSTIISAGSHLTPLQEFLLDQIQCERCVVAEDNTDVQEARSRFYASNPLPDQEYSACDWAATSALAAYSQGYRDALALFQGDRLFRG